MLCNTLFLLERNPSLTVFFWFKNSNDILQKWRNNFPNDEYKFYDCFFLWHKKINLWNFKSSLFLSEWKHILFSSQRIWRVTIRKFSCFNTHLPSSCKFWYGISKINLRHHFKYESIYLVKTCLISQIIQFILSYVSPFSNWEKIGIQPNSLQ